MEVPGQVRPPSGLWSSSKAGAAHRWCAAPVCVVARRRGVPGLPARSSHAQLRGAGPVYVEIAPLRGAGPSRPLVARAASVARRVASGLKDKTCWFCGDFSALLRGKVGVGGGCFIASLCVVPGWARRCTACGCLFYRESVRGSLICLGGAWAGRLRRRYSPCHAAGTSLAALPAVLWVAAHDSRPASFPRMSHAIPPTPCLTAQPYRWNYNVCRYC